MKAFLGKKKFKIVSLTATIAVILLVFNFKTAQDDTKYDQFLETNSSSQQFIKVFKETAKDLAKIMNNYEFPDGENSFKGKKIVDLAQATGGTPIRSIIVSTWRSGSSFLADIMKNTPANFYFYEPLRYRGNIQVENTTQAEEDFNLIRKVLNCDYSDLDSFLKFSKVLKSSILQNHRLSKNFNQSKALCSDPTILKPFCKLFPVQIMKLVRFRLKFAGKLLEDPRSVE